MQQSRINEALDDVLKIAGNGCVQFCVGAGWGLRSLNNKANLLGFGASLAIMTSGVMSKSTILTQTWPSPILNYAALTGVSLAPMIYLNIIGYQMRASAELYKKTFENMNFLGKDKKTPLLISKTIEDKKINVRFKSMIPLSEWQRNIDVLETILDATIVQVEPGKNSKRVIEIGAIPAEYKIPDHINWKDEYAAHKDGVIVFGESALGIASIDLNKTPHILAAGETGSGKSVILRMVLWQMLLQGSRVFMVDFKGGVEFGIDYEKYGNVVMQRENALEMFKSLVQENEKRLELFRKTRVKNLKEYNKKTGSNLCRIGVFVDELAEMTDKSGLNKEDKMLVEEIEAEMSKLARPSRATGINLILGTQRPDAKVVTGQIKTNVPVRISGRFADAAASEIVLGNTLATKLPDIKGRFLLKSGPDSIPFQAFYFDDERMLRELDIVQGGLMTEQHNPITLKPPIIFENKLEIESELKIEKTPKKVEFSFKDMLNTHIHEDD